ncbi:flagellin [Halorubellus sp. JP-L1]|uniref:flagellin n=1 Tax=Halorubellus sp. JP-L1 TaxID=2715753 RepID=UPI001407A767|nr:flagellin [Halorubellus sp. JP-L1]NHN41648.1 flagellin [Halorubellus sp. JP-L1]
MGFSTSGSMAIVFVGVLIAVSTAYPVMSTANERVQTAMDEERDRTVDQRNSDIALWNVTYDAGNDTLVVRVNNTGSRTLSVTDTDLVVDGEYTTGYASSVAGETSRSIWVPGETLRFELSTTTRPDRVRVVTEFGIAETETDI